MKTETEKQIEKITVTMDRVDATNVGNVLVHINRYESTSIPTNEIFKNIPETITLTPSEFAGIDGILDEYTQKARAQALAAGKARIEAERAIMAREQKQAEERVLADYHAGRLFRRGDKGHFEPLKP